MQQLFIKKKKKKREKRRIEKWTSVWIIKTVLRWPPKKEEEMNKIAHVFLQMFPSFKREICFQGAQ
jgi:hypothetical protein